MNSMQIKSKLKNISKEKNIDFNTLLRLYMYDRFIERLSISKYKHNFILKGGFYLSTFFGIENRNTMDIDTAFKNADFNEENVVKMIKEIISIDISDNAKINFLGIEEIRDEDEYGGFRINLIVELYEIKEKFHIDIATGDPITPKEISYKYKTLLDNKVFTVWAYNIETVLAEKIETILNRLEVNGRMRDFYDVYLIYTKEWKKINRETLKKAIKKTFNKRSFRGDIIENLTIIKYSEVLKNRWKKYANKYDYAKNIEFDEIIKCLENIISIIKPIFV